MVTNSKPEENKALAEGDVKAAAKQTSPRKAQKAAPKEKKVDDRLSVNDEGHRAFRGEHFSISEAPRSTRDLVLISVGRTNNVGPAGLIFVRSEWEELVEAVNAFDTLPLDE